MLIEFCERVLMRTNTCFEHNLRRRYTWKAPGDIRHLQIDYILMKQRYRNSVKNAAAYPGDDCDSDHNLVMIKVKLRLKRVCSGKKIKKWNIEKLTGGHWGKVCKRC